MRDRRIGIAVTAAVLAFVLAAGPWFGGSDDNGPAVVAPSPIGSSPVPLAPTPSVVPKLLVQTGQVSGRGPAGTAPRSRLRSAAAAIRATLTELYTAGFLDPQSLDAGGGLRLLRLFDRGVRGRARKDVGELTLGRTARALDEIRPRRALLSIRFLTDRSHRPITAFAEMDFAATGVAGDAELAVRHRGRYVLRRVSDGWRIAAYKVRSRVPSPGQVRAEARVASGAPAVPSRHLLFVLVIGSDARPGQAVQRARADSIHLVGVNPGRDRASIVGIPRDSYVTIPGAGTDKINAALVRGGPDLLVATVERLAGIRIDGYVLTGFEGFDALVSAIGGLDLVVPYQMSDRASHARFRQGPTHLSGREALAFSRNRHDAPGGDFGRSLNQGRVLIAALRGLQAAMRSDRVGLLPWALAGDRHLRTDLSLRHLVDLGLAAERIDPDRVGNTVVPGRVGSAGGRSVVFLSTGADTVFRDLARDAILER